VLRVFRLGGGELTSRAHPPTADAAPALDGRSVVVSGGRVFFRTAEAAAARQQTELVSGDRSRSPTSISADGRFVAFEALRPGDANGIPDVFVHDRLTRVTERVSVDSRGGEGNGSCSNLSASLPGGCISLSADGRFVAFESAATSLAPG